jgi:hypothetical protein
MNHPLATSLAAAVLLCVASAGCEKAAGTPDAGAGSGGAPGSDAGTDTQTGAGGAMATGDAATSDAVAASGEGGRNVEATCTTMANAGELAPELAGQGEFPAPAGGAVKEGVYHLVRFEIFAPELPDPVKRKETIAITGNAFTWVAQDPDGSESRMAGTWAGEQVQLHLTFTCPAAGVDPFMNVPYTATPTELRLFDTTDDNREIHVYTRE